MNLEELATKDDLNKLLQEVSALLHDGKKPIDREGMLMGEAQKKLGGVSDFFIHTLREKGVLSANKVGSLWVFNREQVIDLIPEYLKIKKS